MPPIPPRPGLPSVYLDVSHLSAAHGSSRGRDDPAYGGLQTTIEQIAESANLCLSHTHIQEIALWGDETAAHWFASWLDELPTVWVMSSLDLEPAEDECWTLRALGHEISDPCPFVASSVAAHHVLNIEAASDALRTPRIAELLPVYRQLDSERYRSGALETAKQAHADQQLPIDASRREEKIKYLERVELRRKAYAVLSRLQTEGRPVVATNAHGTHACDLLVELAYSNPRAMPGWRVRQAYMDGWVKQVGRRQVGSNRFGGFASSVEDHIHLGIGAAYCDVFTCDADVDASLGDARLKLGKPRQLSTAGAGGAAFFAERLVEQIERVSTRPTR